MQAWSLARIQTMFLTLRHGDAIERGKLGVVTLFRIHFSLVGMDIVGEIPIGVLVLRRQAVGVHRGVGGPGMNLRQRKVLVDERHAVAIFLQQFGKQRLMHAGAERDIRSRHS